MELKPVGGIVPTLSVRDEAGNEYACPQTVLRNPNLVSEEEKAHGTLERPVEKICLHDDV